MTAPLGTTGAPPTWEGEAFFAASLAATAACAALAAAMGYFALRRKGVPFRRLGLLATAFLLASAAAHLGDALEPPGPGSRLPALAALAAALVSWVTLVVLVPLIPRLLALRSPQELEAEVGRRLQQLRDSEAQMRAVVETAADGIMTLDDNGTVRSANQACRLLFGVAPEAMVGQRVNRFLASRGLSAAGDRFRRGLVDTGEARIFGLGDEAVGRRQDGGTFPASISMSKTHTAGGALLTVIVHDLSEPKKTEEALRHSEARLRMVLDQVPAILCSTDRHLCVTLLTCSVGTGLSGLGLDLARFVGSSLLDDHGAPPFVPADAFARALQGESVTAEVEGGERTLEFHVDPLRGDGGAIVGAVGVGLDVTERNRVEKAQDFYAAQLRERNEALVRSNQELDEFAYVASHDLREPLRGIHNYASFLIEDHGDAVGPDGRARLETLKQLTQRMDALIESLLQFSRVGRVDLAVQETDLNEVVDEVLASLQISVETGGVEVRFARDLPTVRCDRVRIAEVFRNLIANALKYNDKSRRWIEVGVAEAPSAANNKPGAPATGCANGQGACRAFYVRDNGIGIPQQHWEAIFRIFKRLHGRDKYGGGTGAGLTIVKKIVERHGGRIWVESVPGEGSTFSFTIGEKTYATSGPLIR